MRRRAESSRRRWLWILLVVVLLGAVYWLIRPEPGRPEFTHDPMSFGDVRFGIEGDPMEVVVTNAGELPMETSAVQITGDAASDFLVLEDGCSVTSLPTGGTCSLSLRFTPTAVGERQATLELTGRKVVPLTLTGRSTAPRLDRQPESIEFAGQPVGERAAGADLRIANGGTADLELRKVYVEGRHASEFQLAGRCTERTLAPGESCGFRIAFSPQAAGPRSAELLFETDTPAEIERVSLAGTGIWDGPELVVEPTRYDAGLQRVGSTPRPRTVRFVNRAAESVEVASLEISSRALGFGLSNDGCRGVRLDPGDDCTVEVGFSPSGVGDRSATLDLRLAGGGGASVPLAGRGGNARLELARSEVDLGSAGVDADTRQASLELVSVGEIGLRIERLAIEGGAASSFSVDGRRCTASAVAPGARCTVAIAFRPLSEGSARAELVIRSDSGDGEVRVGLSGDGLAGRLVAEPERLSFGSIHRGDGEEQTVRLQNGGSAPFEISRVSIGGRAADEYLIADNACDGAEIPPGGECAVRVRFLPGAEGRRLAFLVLDHGAIAGPGELALAGEGLPPVPTVRIEPTALDLGPVGVGEIGAIRTVTVRNPGLGPLQIRDIALVGTAPSHFRLVPGTCSGVPRLAPRSDCSFGVRFTPLAAGTWSAEISIDHDAPGGPSRVTLAGQGVAAVEPLSSTVVP